MNTIPSPSAFRSPSRFSTSMRVDASSMLMISSATRYSMSSSSARAIEQPLELAAAELVRELAEDVPRVERHGLERGVDASRSTPRG